MDDKSALSVLLNVSNESLNKEEQQKISIQILDGKSNDAVPYAKVRMDLFYPLGRFENLIDNNTDVTADKYQAKTESAKFRVKPTSTEID